MHFLLALIMLASGSMPQSIYGVALARDGDTLSIGGNTIRLHGIDAPESDQFCTRDGRAWACGEEGTDQLRRLIRGGELRCDALDSDQYGRTLARCYLRGLDINRAMVESGYAVAYRKYSTEFVEAEEQAKAARRGIWASTFELPSVHRQGGRSEANADTRRPAQRPVRRRLGDRVMGVGSRVITLVGASGSTIYQGCPIIIRLVPRPCSARRLRPKPQATAVHARAERYPQWAD
jgi:endonuclease YncB( thermonuclease family)